MITASLSRNWNTGCNKWRITNLGAASRKEHKYSSFCWSSKTCGKKSQAPHVNKDSSPPSVLMFSKEIFHLLVEQTEVLYQQHLDGKAGSSRQLPDTTLPDMMTYIALALHMGHTLKDTLHDYWFRQTATHAVLWWDHDMRQIFTHIAFSAFCRQFTETWWRLRIWLTMETKDCLWQTEWGLC